MVVELQRGHGSGSVVLGGGWVVFWARDAGDLSLDSDGISIFCFSFFLMVSGSIKSLRERERERERKRRDVFS